MSVYALKDPRDGRVRYVGQSRRPEERLEDHIRYPATDGMKAWMLDLESNGLQPEMTILRGANEADWIARLSPDLNIAPGRSDVETKEPSVPRLVRFKDSEWNAAKEAAAMNGGTISAFVRHAVREKVARDRRLSPAVG